MKVTLTVVKGPELGRIMEFHEPRGFIIGRAKDADFRLPADDLYVGRRHVYLEICPPVCRFRDIGETNPAHVNGKPVVEGELADGDVLEVGYTQLRVSMAVAKVHEMRACPKCGDSVEVVPGDRELATCAACRAARPPARQASPTWVARCASCGADLGRRANSDGRAADLADVALYACERCVPAREAGLPSTIGVYEVRRALGAGGFGTVYLVYHQATARLWALKRVKDLTDQVLVKRFEREVRLMRDSVHPCIMRCLETGLDGQGIPFLVSEYASGGSLEDLVVGRSGRLPAKDAIPIISQVLDGLEYLHTRQVIHRDIKPANILLTRSQSGDDRKTWVMAKLADFGLAKSYARAGGTRLTKKDTGMGTLMYMPPEQVRDAGAVREPADLYAVGVTLYYLLTGRYSFDFPSPGEVEEFRKKEPGQWKNHQEGLRALMRLNRIMHPYQIILSEDPVPIRQRDGSVPKKLAEVVDRVVMKDAGARFQTVPEFRRALEQAVR